MSFVLGTVPIICKHPRSFADYRAWACGVEVQRISIDGIRVAVGSPLWAELYPRAIVAVAKEVAEHA